MLQTPSRYTLQACNRETSHLWKGRETEVLNINVTPDAIREFKVFRSCKWLCITDIGYFHKWKRQAGKNPCFGIDKIVVECLRFQPVGQHVRPTESISLSLMICWAFMFRARMHSDDE